MLSTSSKLKVKFLFINQLVNKYDKDPLITQYVRNLTWYITPVVNPDGYEFSRSSQDPDVSSLWQKEFFGIKNNNSDSNVAQKPVTKSGHVQTKRLLLHGRKK